MEDAEIIDLYWQRDQRAIDETHGKYGGFLAGIAWNILRSHSDAEECVNDTYLRTWNAIPPARPSAFRAWLGRIVRNLSLDRWKQSRTAKRGGDGIEVLLGELDDCVCRSPTEPRRRWRTRKSRRSSARFCGGRVRRAASSSCGGTGTGRAWRILPPE